MPMIYEASKPLREFLLFYGGPGTGKSSAVLSIILHTPNVNHYVIDAEGENYLRCIWEDERYRVLKERLGDTLHIAAVDSTNWNETLTQAQEYGARAEAGDWIHHDTITDSWEAVQRWFSDNIFNETIEDFFLAARQQMQLHNSKAATDTRLKEQKNLQPFEGFTDWTIINPQYKRLYRVYTNETKAHVTWCAEQDALSKPKSGQADRESKANKDLFGDIGYKPKGQKQLGHRPHSVFHMGKSGGAFNATTAKDRGRAEMVDEEYGEDFAKFYLPGIGGWTKKLVRA